MNQSGLEVQLLVNLMFPSDALREEVSDLARLRRTYGEASARSISRRLQQLEAMASLADLGYLPFAWRKVERGYLEIDVADGVALVVATANTNEGSNAMTDLIVIELTVRSSVRPTR